MAILENVVTAAYTVITLALTVASWRAWHYARSQKVLFLAVGFAILFLKGVFLSIGLFLLPAWETLFVPSLLLDLAVIVFFYLAVIRRAA